MTYDIREALCEVGRRVWTRGFVASNDGNFSYRLDEETVLATPTMVSKGSLTPEDLVLVDLEGNQLGGARRTTSEIRVHLNIYRHRRDVRSVVHTHPPHATAFAVARRPLPKCVLPEVEFFLGEVPLVPYHTPGTWDFARSLDPWLDTHDVFLMENHGAVAIGADPFDAYYKMETLDQYCRILILTRQLGGDWNRLSESEMTELLGAKGPWGVRDPREGQDIARACADPVLPRAAAPPGEPVIFPRWDGETYPRVSDVPKPSSAPPPASAPERDLRPAVEDAVREALRRLGL